MPHNQIPIYFRLEDSMNDNKLKPLDFAVTNTGEFALITAVSADQTNASLEFIGKHGPFTAWWSLKENAIHHYCPPGEEQPYIKVIDSLPRILALAMDEYHFHVGAERSFKRREFP
jgi:hypothetical protein